MSAKIGLNTHYYGGKTILELHRIMEMVANKQHVLTLKGDDEDLNRFFEPMVTFFNETDYAEKYHNILSLSTLEYNRIALKRLRYFRSLPGFLENFVSGPSILIGGVVYGNWT
jgi:hypothetical protein